MTTIPVYDVDIITVDDATMSLPIILADLLDAVDRLDRHANQGFDDIDTEELGAAWLHTGEAASFLYSVKKRLEQTLCDTLDGPTILPDGTVAKPGRAPSRKGFDKDILWDRINDVYGRLMVDPATGETVKVWDPKAKTLLDVATGRGSAWKKAAGLDLDTVCEVEWKDKLEVIK